MHTDDNDSSGGSSGGNGGSRFARNRLPLRDLIIRYRNSPLYLLFSCVMIAACIFLFAYVRTTHTHTHMHTQNAIHDDDDDCGDGGGDIKLTLFMFQTLYTRGIVEHWWFLVLEGLVTFVLASDVTVSFLLRPRFFVKRPLNWLDTMGVLACIAAFVLLIIVFAKGTPVLWDGFFLTLADVIIVIRIVILALQYVILHTII